MCLVKACPKPAHARGRCKTHYERWRISPDFKPQTLADRFWPRVSIGEPDECWPWTGTLGGNGYGQIKEGGPDGGRKVLTHRVAFLLTHGHWPEPHCLHSCDNPPCCNPAHLREGNQSDNMRDAMKRNRWTPPRWERSEDHPSAKLTDAQVAEIRHRYAAGGITQTALATEFGVSQSQVHLIVRMKQRVRG